MRKLTCVLRDFSNNFISKRFLVFFVFQFSILHYFISPVKSFSHSADYPASPWILPFLGQNIYFVIVYGISVVYFYSNVPFLQRHEMYMFVRLGRTRWMHTKILRIWLSAPILALTEFVLSILLLFPNIEWTLQWGKLYTSLALADSQMPFFFSYKIMNENHALCSCLLFLVILSLVTGLVGMVMFTLSLYVNRAFAVLISTAMAICSIVFKNIYIFHPWFGFFSPFSWLDLLLLYGKLYNPSPSLGFVIAVVSITTIFCSMICIKHVQSNDMNWISEE